MIESPDKWEAVKALFEAVLDSTRRRSFLAEQCADASVRAEVERLLLEHDQAGSFLSRPAVEDFLAMADAPTHGFVEGVINTKGFTGTSRFSVQRQIGAGAFGTVYQVWDREQRTSVALKLLHSWKPEALLRFKREFRSLVQVQHTNLVRLYELFSEGDSWFFTMELVEGQNFFEYLRPPVKSGDWQTVKSCLLQLVRGVHALHLSNRIHRDLKPANVLVTPDKRVVVLDFGLVREIPRYSADQTVSLVGTPAFMSPEQALGRHVSVASDWYSVGVMLFHVLAGKLPDRQSCPWSREASSDIAVSTRTANQSVPEDLDRLCSGLLEQIPEKRPGIEVLLGTLETSLSDKGKQPSRVLSGPSFVGRDEELSRLEGAFAETLQGRLNVFLIEGPSGIGKSALIRRFIAQLPDRYSNLLAFKGKCYEFESVPYKGVDGLVDELCDYLQGLQDTEIQALLPRDASLLPKLFPVLGRVAPIDNAPTRAVVPDEQELRQRIFSSLREMIARIADRHPLILWIDDIQWADRDSSTFLAELCSPPNQPPLLLLLTYRSEDVLTNPTLQYLGSFLVSNNSLFGNWKHLTLKGLTENDSRALILQLTSDGLEERVVTRIATESQGHPLFIRELALLSGEGGIPVAHATKEDLGLQDVLRSRIAALDSSERRLLEFICIAAQPLAQPLLFSLVDSVGGGQTTEPLSYLIAQNLIRVSGTGGDKKFEPFHDQIRTAASSLLSAYSRRDRHRQLAAALSALDGTEAQVLVTHYREAGDLHAAFRAALLAAETAERQLAFDRAATFYESAIAVSNAEPEGRASLYRKLADALSKAGRGRDSAQAYFAAAQCSSADAKFEMRRLASDQFLRSGYIEEGMALFSELAKQVGIHIPRNPRQAITGIAIGRLRSRMGLLVSYPTLARMKPTTNTAKLEMLRTGGVLLAIVDPVVAAYFQVCHIAEAVKAKDPTHMAMAFALEAGIRAATGTSNTQVCLSLLDRAQEIADTTHNVNVMGFVLMFRAYIYYLLLLVPEGSRAAQKAIDFFRTYCTGVTWELTASYAMLFWCKCWAGEVAQIRDLQTQLLQEGTAWGDVDVEVSLRLISYAHLSYLASDRSDECLAECDRALQKWPLKGFTLQHYGTMFVRVETHLYRGEYVEARRILLANWDKMTDSSILQCWRPLEIMALFLRSRVTLACWLSRPCDPRLRAEIEDYAKRLERIPCHWCGPIVSLLRAGLATGHRRRDSAIKLLESAYEGFERASLHAFASAALHIMGKLRGGWVGDTQMRVAADFMESQHVKAPESFIRMLIPGQWA